MTVVRKKISMLGAFATGKTSLVRQYVHSIFSERYQSTVGVKIDRKKVEIGDKTVDLMLWDIEGSTEKRGLSQSYLRGSAGLILVVDGTRRETFDEAFELSETARSVAGVIPATIAINKSDLTDDWQLGDADVAALKQLGGNVILTSAKSGVGVQASFEWLAAEMLRGRHG